MLKELESMVIKEISGNLYYGELFANNYNDLQYKVVFSYHDYNFGEYADRFELHSILNKDNSSDAYIRLLTQDEKYKISKFISKGF